MIMIFMTYVFLLFSSTGAEDSATIQFDFRLQGSFNALKSENTPRSYQTRTLKADLGRNILNKNTNRLINFNFTDNLTETKERKLLTNLFLTNDHPTKNKHTIKNINKSDTLLLSPLKNEKTKKFEIGSSNVLHKRRFHQKREDLFKRNVDVPYKTSAEMDEVPLHKRTSVQYSSLVGPSFNSTSLQTKINALVGKTARITCVVNNLHNYTVSWVRARDINLLTSGEVTYSSEKRFSAINPARGPRWILKIHHLNVYDSGRYLCQISTSPPISNAFHLTVTASTSEVHPSSDVFLKVGSPVRLVCTIKGCPYPASPAWYKGTELLKDLIIEESTLTSVSTKRADSSNETLEGSYEYLHSNEELLIARAIFEKPKATLNLSGTYSCRNSCTSSLNLTIHVLIGDEETAAMQHINSGHSLLFIDAEALWIMAFLLHYQFSVYR